jgi:peptidylprolyl isomerase
MNQPFAFTVGRGHAIRGFDLLLPKLSVGDKVKTRIPWRLAYGEVGVKHGMPPKQDLDYEIEVVGVVPPPSWEVVKKGDGAPAEKGRIALIHYVGTLASGEKFDDSRTSGKPFRFRVGAAEVIEGWDRVVAQMRVGDRWNVTVPWFYAYGADGLPPKIPEMTDVRFDLELVGVE